MSLIKVNMLQTSVNVKICMVKKILEIQPYGVNKDGMNVSHIQVNMCNYVTNICECNDLHVQVNMSQ